MVKGSRVVAVRYSEQAVEIVLERGCLRLDAGPTGLEWDYVEVDPTKSSRESTGPLGAIELVWPTLTSVWRRDEMLHRMRERPLGGVFATGDRLCVYPDRGEPLDVAAIFDVDEKRPMLFWWWGDD